VAHDRHLLTATTDAFWLVQTAASRRSTAPRRLTALALAANRRNPKVESKSG